MADTLEKLCGKGGLLQSEHRGGVCAALHLWGAGHGSWSSALQPDTKARSSGWHFQFAMHNSKRAKPLEFIKGWGESTVCAVLPNGWLASSLYLLLSSGESQAVVIHFETLL